MRCALVCHVPLPSTICVIVSAPARSHTCAHLPGLGGFYKGALNHGIFFNFRLVSGGGCDCIVFVKRDRGIRLPNI